LYPDPDPGQARSTTRHRPAFGAKVMTSLASHPITPATKWTAFEAFLGVLTIVAVSDVGQAVNRLHALHAFAQRSPFLQVLGEQGLVRLHGDVAHRIDEAGCNALQQACVFLPEEMRASTYAACFDLLAEKGDLSEPDRVLASRLRGLLRLDDGQAKTIASVLLLKNQF
jgi:hypothetical protein